MKTFTFPMRAMLLALVAIPALILQPAYADDVAPNRMPWLVEFESVSTTSGPETIASILATDLFYPSHAEVFHHIELSNQSISVVFEVIQFA